MRPWSQICRAGPCRWMHPDGRNCHSASAKTPIGLRLVRAWNSAICNMSTSGRTGQQPRDRGRSTHPRSFGRRDSRAVGRSPQVLGATQLLFPAVQRGRKTYKKRAPSIEPGFAQIKHNRGIRTISRRGLAAADSEWMRKISLSSSSRRTLAFRSLISPSSSLVAPWRCPPSIWACTTQRRTVSLPRPSRRGDGLGRCGQRRVLRQVPSTCRTHRSLTFGSIFFGMVRILPTHKDAASNLGRFTRRPPSN